MVFIHVRTGYRRVVLRRSNRASSLSWRLTTFQNYVIDRQFLKITLVTVISYSETLAIWWWWWEANAPSLCGSTPSTLCPIRSVTSFYDFVLSHIACVFVNFVSMATRWEVLVSLGDVWWLAVNLSVDLTFHPTCTLHCVIVYRVDNKELICINIFKFSITNIT